MISYLTWAENVVRVEMYAQCREAVRVVSRTFLCYATQYIPLANLGNFVVWFVQDIFSMFSPCTKVMFFSPGGLMGFWCVLLRTTKITSFRALSSGADKHDEVIFCWLPLLPVIISNKNPENLFQFSFFLSGLNSRGGVNDRIWISLGLLYGNLMSNFSWERR